MFKKINIFLKNETFIFNGSIIGYQEILFIILITTVLVYFGIISVLYDAEILQNVIDEATEIHNRESINNINSLNNISAQRLVCKFISSFNKIVYDANELSSSQKFNERLLKLLSESFPSNSIDISYQFLFLIYRKILISKTKYLVISHLQDFSEVMLHRLKIPKHTLVMCYSEIIKLDDSILSKEEKNHFMHEKERLQIIMNIERDVVLQNIKLNILRVAKKIKFAIEVAIFLS
ncbi:hypothetical protein [Cryptosporidium parvum Iowa II]|uniref:Uncharacterized protein n=2 Tax=Cryptosporidium parvum TaxID=5807 RepID=Q5CTM0_CRYPI|nr:hypothetical protein [Cryptosporidium parvum Iowa II]EAK88753.1 hypothetical protein cgd2_2470 [Cryptosporidium parvum Iowa II]QOY42986.1 Uncharacterized protein CPATCC_0028340 [Cryptosporidium parvum]WKS76543.1 hypothetical protein CPCDC_2g2470 [Cryptosporidium sp. 43IA8]WRK31036.1 Uncharacterized protein cpbgf_2002470 [Cryptosporidium parvum]|eukprot:QOY42986.1 hypothetical protein CPATCC_000685 [Cryptosporidium parvum]